ncbi:universal stress protein [Mucilaginibacter sp. L3T2-6]|uniref:universal stress protein n=1 Tax=Mucilaginibacter sp. L3T2-6 TaxID=3062491 RepID=UPI0026754BD2|nr:universal stress protein [Mucilaginibacter sp. L3T2-6]MDO3643670.1 universal stress protein [Mucilaginibacter sp. L3T2-6]MDV6216082.1 universal stress protein [Mucilaginibacter sp. L3T2-6]
MKRLIIVPTDFSPAAEKAAAYAAMLAEQLSAGIRLCHAARSPASETIANTQLEALAGKFKRDINKLGNILTPGPQVTLLHGGPGLAGNLGACLSADMIVIGTSGTGRQHTGWTGSGGKNILQSATSPVLLIPPSATIRPPVKIAFATTMGKEDYPILNMLEALARDLKTDITIVHVDTGSYDHETRKNLWLSFTGKIRNDKETAPHFTYINIPVNSLAAELNDIAASGSADLLVLSRDIYDQLAAMSTSGHAAALEMAANLHIPLLVAAPSA